MCTFENVTLCIEFVGMLQATCRFYDIMFGCTYGNNGYVLMTYSWSKTHRVQATSHTLCALRRHAGVPGLAVAPSYTTPLPTLCSRINLEWYGRQVFACAGLTLWNTLPATLWNSGNRAQLKKTLKTFLFSN